MRKLSYEREFIKYGHEFQEIVNQNQVVKRSSSQARQRIFKKHIEKPLKRTPKMVNVSYSDLYKKKTNTVCNTPEPKLRRNFLTKSYDLSVNNDMTKSFSLETSQNASIFKSVYPNIKELLEIRQAHLSLSNSKNNVN